MIPGYPCWRPQRLAGIAGYKRAGSRPFDTSHTICAFRAETQELKNNRTKPGASDQSPYFTKARNVIVNTNAAESENCSSFSPLTTACHEGKYLGIYGVCLNFMT